jgi:Domain of unknown function (DUF5069)
LNELMSNQKLLALALNLNRQAPRSLFAPLGDYDAVVARIVDKCRAELAGTAGSYHYNCPLDRSFFHFAGIEAEDLRNFVATGAGDEQIAGWIKENSKVRDQRRIRSWSRRFRFSPMALLLQIDDWMHTRRNQGGF